MALAALIAPAVVLGLAGCGDSAPSDGGPGVEAVPASAAAPSPANPRPDLSRWAQGYVVSDHDGYRVVRVRAVLPESWSGDPSRPLEDVMVLVGHDDEPPPLTGDLEGATVVRVPVTRVAVNHDGDLALLRALDAVDRLVATGGDACYDDEVREAVVEGRIPAVGYSWHAPPDREKLLEAAPDLVVLRVAELQHAEGLEELRRLGMTAIPSLPWAEPDYMGQAEWVRYLSLFLGEEARAERFLDDVARRVETLRSLAREREPVPTLWAYYTGNGTWSANVSTLRARLLADAGGRNVLLSDDPLPRVEGETIPHERLLEEASDAAVWIIGDIHAPPLPSAELLTHIRAWREGRLLSNMGRTLPEWDAYDWYETGTVRPDLVLADLIHHLHPGLLSEHDPAFIVEYRP